MLVRIVAFFTLVVSTGVLAEELTVEDTDLRRIPPAATAILAHPSYSDFRRSGCKVIVGKPVRLENRALGRGWIATTAGGCGWAAASAPIWIVHDNGKGPRIILHEHGYSVTIGKSTQNGLKHIAISAGTAGWYSEQLLKYDGTKYVVARSRDVDLSNPADCRRNKDVCAQ